MLNKAARCVNLTSRGCVLQIGVLNWFAKLWEIDTEEYWGYVTNCGTEGNLHGILVGRENLPDGGLQASTMQQSMLGALLVTG